MKRLIISAVLVMAVGMSGSGCAGHTKKVVVEENVQAVQTPANVSQQVSTVTRTTTTEQVPPEEPRGLLSTTVHFIGDVLALPFRLIGGLLRVLF